MKRIFILILLVILSLSLLTGAAFATYFLLNPDRESNVFDINVTSNNQRIIEFSNLALIPGQSVEYDVNLTSETDVEARVTLQFVRDESVDNGLEKYVYARIKLGGEVLCDAILEEIIAGEPLKLVCNVGADTPKTLNITYYMLDSVGNEAMNAEASFELLVVATNEWSD